MIFAELLTVAKKVNNYLAPASAWTTTSTIKWEAPASKRWFIISAMVKRDAAQTLAVVVKDASDDQILQLTYLGAATDIWNYPHHLASTNHHVPTQAPVILDAGEYVEVTCGGAQGAGAYAALMVLEVDL